MNAPPSSEAVCQAGFLKRFELICKDPCAPISFVGCLNSVLFNSWKYCEHHIQYIYTVYTGGKDAENDGEA